MMSKTSALLTGERIYLRPLNASDAELYYESLYIEETRRLTGTQRHHTQEQIERYISDKAEDRSSVLLLIALQGSGEVIGDIAIQDMDSLNRSANLRIAINQAEHQGAGMGKKRCC